MRNLILNSDLRKLALGAAPVALAGLIAGGFMHPTLKVGDGLGGPQMLAGVAGARGEPSASGSASWTNYQGRVPEYVVGADWVRPPQTERAYREDSRDFVQDVEPAEEEHAYAAEERAATAVEQRYEEPAREPVSYPSTSGGAFNPSDLPAAPEPPVEPFGPAAG